jgi:hypothetical protein
MMLKEDKLNRGEYIDIIFCSNVPKNEVESGSSRTEELNQNNCKKGRILDLTCILIAELSCQTKQNYQFIFACKVAGS